MLFNKSGLSFWEIKSFFSDVDFAIIGSGIVGLNAAIHLKEKFPDSNVIILEKGMIPTGASTRNAGFACFGSITELLDDLKHSSEDEVFSLVEKRWKGLEKLQSLTGEKLEFDACGGYELFGIQDEEVHETCLGHLEYFNQSISEIIGKKKTYERVDHKIKDFAFQSVKHIIVNTAEGQINTGGMMSALLELAIKKGIKIFNGASVESILDKGGNVEILLEDGREIFAKKVLVATNGFAKCLLKDIEVKPARNQVLITKEIPNLKVKGTFHYDEGYYYFRNVGDRVLFGGGRNLSPKIEETQFFGTTEIIQKQLIKMLDEIILPNTNYEIEMWWSGILGVGEIKKPIIKKTSENIAVAVRMGGMGIAIGSLVGSEGADLL